MYPLRKIFKKSVIFSIPILFGVYYTLFVLLQGVEETSFNEAYLKLWERGLSGIFLVIFMLAILEVVLLDEYMLWYEGSFKNIVIRIGYKRFIFQRMIKTFIKVFLYTLATHLLLVLSLNIFHDFTFQDDITTLQHLYFSKHIFINLLTFILLSSIGTGFLYMCFYPCMLLIKNKYMMRTLPIIILFISIFASTIYSPIIYQFFEYSLLISILVLSPLPTSLIEPGGSWYQYAGVEFFGGIVFYTLLMIVVLWILRKRGILYDW